MPTTRRLFLRWLPSPPLRGVLANHSRGLPDEIANPPTGSAHR